ncbi:MAG: RNA polymerase sigma factor [Bacteroidetes bacterium]|nr:RNA polymerase sigma factor [Bacteroidota bacterium]
MAPHDSGNEKILLLNAKAGDDYSFKQLVEANQQGVVRVVIGMLGDSDDAKDVAQEVFIQFYKNMDKFKGDSTLRTYLTRIAINLSLNELKKMKLSRLRIVSDTYSIHHIEDSGRTQDSNELSEMVQKAILQLEPEFRVVVVLRLMDGYSTKEVAEMLEIPLGTVLSRLARGQQKLKTILIPKI